MSDPFKPADLAVPSFPAQAPGAKKPAPSPAAPTKPASESVAVAEPEKPAACRDQRLAVRPTPVELPLDSKSAPPPPLPSAPAVDRSQQLTAIGICLAACALVGVLAIAWSIRQPSQSKGAVANPLSPDASAATAADSSNVPKIAANAPVAPGVIATVAELEKPWSSKEFTYRDPISGQETPALVVHLSRGGYWGISMIEPFGSCRLEFVTDLDRLRSVYDFQADHPMVGDPCNQAVFDLLQYGDVSTAEVRGALVHGMGVRPPLAIEIEQQGNQIVAVKME